MDDTDRKLLILLGAEPRMHLRELARRLGVSRQAVHHRMRILMETGVIKGMSASVSVSYLGAIPVAVFGISRTASVSEALDRLGESELSRRAIAAGGNYIYVTGFLREMSELEGYVEFVRRAAEMPEPTVGIFNLDDGLMPYYSVDGGGKREQSHRELTPIDFRIIASLKDNARRSVTDIADMLGVSVKTIRRHLETMIRDGSLEFQMPSDLTLGGDMLLLMHVSLRDDADKREKGSELLSKYPFQDAYVRTFSNLPGLLMWVFWSDNMTEIRKALSGVGDDEQVAGVMLNFAYVERLYTSWREKVTGSQTSQVRKAKKRGPRVMAKNP